VRRIAPHDRRARLRRNHKVQRILQNQHAIRYSQRQRAPRSAFAADHRDRRHPQPRHFQQIARNRLGLAPLLRSQTRKRSRQIDEADHWPPKLLGNLHRPERLAIAFGMRHSEVTPHAILRRSALAVADHQHFFALQARHSASHGLVVAIGAIPVNLAEISKDALDEIHWIRPLGMPRPLDSDPCR
jgi:hypothetical protein